MNLETFSPRAMVAIGILAIIPAIAFAASISLTAGTISVVSTALIVSSLYLAFGPAESPSADGPAGV